MSNPSTAPFCSWSKILLASFVLAAIALLPWWRNHNYLTDFYDYGLVISGVGRIEAGERLYVDVVSPIQSGIFLLNGAAEKLFGGTFQAMTWGNALLIAGATLAFGFVLSRRWPWFAAVGAVAGIICGSVVQHTIIWHNTTGVICLALVVWGSALAPVLRRTTWLWHAMVVAGLWLSGLNKLNFHIVALAVACGWTLRAGLTGGESWRKVAATLAVWVTAGIALPFCTELGWTGASLSTWWYNVVEMPFASRAGKLGQIFTWKFQVFSPHIYYGNLRLPQIGLVSVVMLALTGFVALTNQGPRGWMDRVIAVVAVLFAMCAAAALHATNFDIGYVSLAAALVLTVGLWLGFGLVPRGLVFWGGLVIPCVLVGAVAWESAWRGQRSQFGHTSAPREAFLPAETADPAYAYLRGLRLPPEMHMSLETVAKWLHSIEKGGRSPVFYGPGIEWLERIFPAVKPGPMPLLAQWGATYGQRDLDRLHHGLQFEGCYTAVLSVHAWDAWTKETAVFLDYFFAKSELGPVIDLRERTAMPAVLRDAVNFRNQFGYNTAANVLNFNGTRIEPLADSTNQPFLGVSKGTGRIWVGAPINRMRGEAVVQRIEGSADKPAYADFSAVLHQSRAARWSARLELPVGQRTVAVPFEIDGSGEQVDLVAEIPPAFAQQISGGYRGLRITDVMADSGPAPYLRAGKPADEPINLSETFIAGAWRPERCTLRAGSVTPAGVELRAGGELWLYSPGLLTELLGEISLAEGKQGSVAPFIRVVWYKAGRFELIHQEVLSESNPKTSFRAWSAEFNGWFGILVDQVPGSISVTVRITKAEVAPQ